MRNKPKARISSRMRLVGWITGIIAIALIIMVVAVSFLQRSAAQRIIDASLNQEVEEMSRLAETGVDPTTGESFSTPERFLEIYLQRQVASPTELIVGGIDGEGVVHEQYGENAASWNSLAIDTRNALKVPRSSGTITDAEWGKISWQAVDIQTAEGTGIFVVAEFHKSTDDELRRQIVSLVLIALVAFAVTAVVAWQVSGRLIGHVGKFEHEVEQATMGRRTRHLPTEGGEEYGQLATAANDLLDHANVALERERQYSENISYTLRAPLALVEAEIHQAIEARDGTKLSEPLEEIKRLRQITESLAEISTIDRQRFLVPDSNLEVRRFLVDLAQDILDRYPNIDVRVDDVDQTLVVSADQAGLRRAMRELFSNAFDAAGPNGTFLLSAHPFTDDVGEWVRVTLTDNGRGIPDNETSRILERFTVASNDPDPGPGLGLPLARSIAEAHYGRLSVDSGDLTHVHFDIPHVHEADEDV